MRLAAYAGTSMVLAVGVVLRAFHQRANFYSACVYMSQSNACLMILANLVILCVCAFMLGLQRLFYGPLRPIEVEQLYEKAWFAITETCLAMTIFREEVGGWFLVMFLSLLSGKVWGWIGEGRVEVLEQQPPANPRLFHARLSFSLFISMAFDVYMLKYSIQTVLRQARPNMMVMFAFEFAVLTIASSSTAARYAVSLVEGLIIKRQTMARLEERRAEIRAARERRLSTERAQNSAAGDGASTQTIAAPEEDAVDELDIDVPGWEEKGRWIFYLDLATDFLKLFVYISFFSILLTFYGLPIHIMRDLFITTRSFIKRIHDFLRYRNATRDMNQRYPDASAEEIAREEVCIICREEMRPWQQPNAPAPDEAGGRPRPATGHFDERSRPKKLPCGHVLHFGCLRSWLERQQNCPTCRRPVLITDRIRVVPTRGGVNVPNQNPAAQGDQQHPPGDGPGQPNNAPGNGGQNRGRIVNFGPFRVGFGMGPPNIAEGLAQRMNEQQGNAAGRQLALGFGFGRQPANQRNPSNPNTGDITTQLRHVEQQIMQQINGLRSSAEQLQIVRALQGELARLRIAQANPGAAAAGVPPPIIPPGRPIHHNLPALPFIQPNHPPQATLEAFTGQGQQALGPNHPNLPAGMTLPPGWTVLPLERVGPHTNPISRPPNGILRPASTPAVDNSSTAVGSAPPDSSSAPSTDTVPGDDAQGNHLVSSTSRSSNLDDGNVASAAHSQPDLPQENTNHVTSAQLNNTSQPILSPNHFRNLAAQHNASLGDQGSRSQVPAWESRNEAAPTPPKVPSAIPDAASNDKIAGEEGSSSSAEQRREQKGKGRAATVEDFMEDVE